MRLILKILRVVFIILSILTFSLCEFSRGGQSLKGEELYTNWKGIIAILCGKDSDRNMLWFITPKGSRLITEYANLYGQVLWSPDGNYLAYRDSNMKLVIVSKDGKNLYTFGEVDYQFSWSWNSCYVLSGVYFDGLYQYSIDGSQKKLLSSYYRTYDHNPVQSRDGKWVYFLHHEYGTTCTIYRIRTAKLLSGATYSDGEKLIDITTYHDEKVMLEPTNDGKVIIAYSGKCRILDPKSKVLHKLQSTVSFHVDFIKLSPNGEYLAVLSSDKVWIIDSSSWQVLNYITSPDDGRIESFAWSSDSQALVIVTSYGKFYIWRINDPQCQKIFEISILGNVRIGKSLSWTQ